MKSVRGYLRVCLQSYELQSRIDPSVAMGTTTMQCRRKKSSREDEERKKLEKK